MTTETTKAWNEGLLKNPHTVADKRSRVQKMFAAIAPSYDLNNRLHSLWMDQHWRRKAVKLAVPQSGDQIIDVACGTGDLTLEFANRFEIRGPEFTFCGARIIGIDFTFPMLPLARRKGAASPSHVRYRWGGGSRRHEFNDYVRWVNGDALALPLPEDFCNIVSIAFGIRNVADPRLAIREFFRVLRPGGRLIILEFSLPTNPVLRGLYDFYFRKILPRTATLISGDKTGAYKYLPESVHTFIGREQMMDMMKGAGFVEVEQFPMTFGVCVCYRGVKR